MKTAILVLGYKKIETFTQVIQALAKQTKQYDLFVKLDNCGESDYINNLINVVKQYFPNANISVRPKRYTLEFHVICSLNEMFQLGYDRVFYTEDDVLYDSNTLEILSNLMDWTDQHLPNTGIVQSWNYNLTDPTLVSEYKKLHGLEKLWYNCTYAPNEIGYTGQNYWGALISKKCWDTCADIVLPHYAQLLTQHNLNFPVFLQTVAKAALGDSTNEVKYRSISRWNLTCWEGILDLAMIVHNMHKICLTVPRSKSIGVTGSTSTNDMFTTVGLDKIKTYEELYPEDKSIPTEFILNKESQEKFISAKGN